MHGNNLFLKNGNYFWFNPIHTVAPINKYTLTIFFKTIRIIPISNGLLNKQNGYYYALFIAKLYTIETLYIKLILGSRKFFLKFFLKELICYKKATKKVLVTKHVHLLNEHYFLQHNCLQLIFIYM